MALVLCALPGVASASVIVVQNNSDSGGGSLRAAVAGAAPGDSITVPAVTIVLATPITVTQASPGVTINGAGAGATTISGNSASSIFAMNTGTVMTVTGLTLTGGIAGGGAGGAIQAGDSSTLTIADSTLTANRANGGAGGAIQMNPSGTLTITNSTLSANQAIGGYGGAIRMQSNGRLTISNSTLSANQANSGFGGAIQMDAGTLMITNSTLNANQANSGFGGAIQMAAGVHGQILNSTINANVASSGIGGGLQSNSNSAAQVALKNTIVSGNTASTGANCSATSSGLVSLGYNDENGTTCAFTFTGDLNADPLLGPLQDNGGPTFTQAPAIGSPVIHGGTSSGCPAADQRGAARSGAPCDIGAFQSNALADLALTGTASAATIAAGQTISYSFSARNNGPDAIGSVQVTDQLPAGATLITTPSGCAGTGTITCHLGSLAVGASVPLVLTARLSTPGRASNTATIGGAPADPNSANDAVTLTTTVIPAAPLAGGSPTVAGLRQSSARWRENNKLAQTSRKKKKPPVGTTFSFSLNQPAAVRLTFTQTAAGRKASRKCVAGTKKNRKKPKCTRTIVAGSLAFNAHTGANRVRFAGRLSATQKLKPGRYTLTITATSAGLRSTPHALRFTIVKG